MKSGTDGDKKISLSGGFITQPGPKCGRRYARDQILKDVQLTPVEIDQIEMAPTNYGYLTHIELISLTLLTARNLVRMLGL